MMQRRLITVYVQQRLISCLSMYVNYQHVFKMSVFSMHAFFSSCACPWSMDSPTVRRSIL